MISLQQVSFKTGNNDAGYQPGAKNNFIVLNLVTREAAMSSEEGVASSSKEPSNTNGAGSTSSNGNSIRLECSVHPSPSVSRLNLRKTRGFVIGCCVHKTEINGQSILDIIRARPSRVTATSYSKLAIGCRVSGEGLEGQGYLLGRDGLDDTGRSQLGTDRPVRSYAGLVLRIALIENVSQTSILKSFAL